MISYDDSKAKGKDNKGLSKAIRLLTEGLKNKYSSDHASLYLPFDSNQLKQAKKVPNNVSLHVIIGIGGSNLGAKAVIDALRPSYNNTKKTFFIDTIHPAKLIAIAKKYSSARTKKRVRLTVISKSGNTKETIINMRAFMKRAKVRGGEVTIITTKNSALDKEAKVIRANILYQPEKVGGRYSVCSVVGLYPMLCENINADLFIKGARRAVKEQIVYDSMASRFASHLKHHFLQKRNIHDTLIFHPDLESLGKWYRQLLAESLGKEHDIKGSEINAGMTPTVSIGTTDLHSVGQLNIGGPDDKYYSIISVKKHPKVLVNGKSADAMLSAIIKGVVGAYEIKNRPFEQYVLDEINEETLGYFMQTKMIGVMMLCHMLSINPFDQPAVELYKKIARSNML